MKIMEISHKALPLNEAIQENGRERTNFLEAGDTDMLFNLKSPTHMGR